MRDSCLFIERIQALFTLCAVGVDWATLNWFAERSRTLERQISMMHLVELDDKIHKLGRGRLGLNCFSKDVSVEVVGIRPSELENFEMHEGSWPENDEEFGIQAILDGLKDPHVRSTLKLTRRHAAYYVNNEEYRTLIRDSLDNRSFPEAYKAERARKKLARGNKRDFVDYLQTTLLHPLNNGHA